MLVRLLESLLVDQESSQLVMGFRVVRMDLQGFLEVLYRFVGIAFFGGSDPQIIKRVFVFVIKLKRRVVLGDRFIGFSRWQELG